MSAKYLKDVEARKPKFIHVYPNGDAYARATFIVLRQMEQKDLENIIRAIEEKVRLPRNRPIRKIFEMSGILITDCIQFENGKFYVAASAENFISLEYGQGFGWVRVGPVRTSKYASVHYVSKSEEEGFSKSLNTSTDMLASTKDTKEKRSAKKSPSRKTPNSIKKDNIKKPIPKKAMTTSEHIESSPIRDEEYKEFSEKDDKEIDKSDLKEEIVDNSNSTGLIESKEHDPTCVQDSKTHDEIENKSHNEEIKNSDNLELNLSNVVETIEDHITENSHHIKEENEEKKEENRNEKEEHLNIEEKEIEDKEEIHQVIKENQNEDNHYERGNIITHEENHNNSELKDEDKEEDNKNVENKEVEHQNEDENVEKEVDTEKLDDAATKIQATFRGHRVRSDLEKMKENNETQDIVNDSTDVSEEINSQKEES